MSNELISAKKPRKSRAQKIHEGREALRRVVPALTEEDLALLKMHRDRFKGREQI